MTFNGRPTDHIWQAGPLCVQKNNFFFRQTHCWFIKVLWAKFCVVRLNKAKIVQKFEFAPNRSKLAHKTSGATYARVERGRNFFFIRIYPQRSPGPIQMKFGTFGHFGTERIGPMTQTRSVKETESNLCQGKRCHKWAEMAKPKILKLLPFRHFWSDGDIPYIKCSKEQGLSDKLD